MIEANEVIVLVIGLLGYIPICYSYFKYSQTKFLFYGYTSGLFAAIATIAENFYFPTTLNYMEHIGNLGVAFFFLLAAILSLKQKEINKKNILRKVKLLNNKK